MIETNGWHVVLGTGPLGAAVARALARRRLRVRLLNRSGEVPELPAGVELAAGDVLRPSDAEAVMRGATVVYHCASPRYTDWERRFPPLQRAIVAAASAVGAKLVVAENLYGYGAVAGPMVETLPLAPVSAKGRIRAELTEELWAAHRAGHVAVAIGRGSDFFGPGVMGSTVGARFFRSVLRGGPVDVLGNPDALHSYTFIDDFGEALATLGERDEALGRAWHVPTAKAVTNRQFAERAIAAASSRAKVRVVPRWLLRAVGLFTPDAREVMEVLYQFDQPFVVDDSAFCQTFAREATPLDQSLAATVGWYRAQDSGVSEREAR
jgi:nucleoside-diphosphate-sugar epimerase